MKLAAGRTATVRVSFTNANGYPAKVQGKVRWESEDEDVAEVEADSSDPLQATIHAGPSAGRTKISAVGDADLGEGVESVEVTLDVMVVARGEAVGGEITPVLPNQGLPGGGSGNRPDNSLPGGGSGGHPDQGLPGSPGHPDQGLPGSPGHPDQGLPGSGGRPDNSLPGQGGPVDPGFGQPGSERPDNSLPGSGGRPDRPDNSLPGSGGKPDNSLPGTPEPKSKR